MDLCGPIEETRGGNRYIATFKDDYSGMSWVLLTPNKQKLWLAVRGQLEYLMTQQDKLIKTVRTDNGTEYVNKEMDSYLSSLGIRHEHSMAYTPQQNGEAEWLNRTLLEKARSMLSEAQLPLDMWGEAIMTANYLRCVTPVAGKVKTPWELFYGVKPDLSNLRAFGCRAYVMIPKQLRKHKLAEVSATGIMVGYANTGGKGPGGKGWRILMDDDGDVKNSRDVSFDETCFPGSEDCDVPSLVDTVSDSDADDGDSDEEEEDTPQPGNSDSQTSDSSESPSPTPPQNSSSDSGNSSSSGSGSSDSGGGNSISAPRAARNRQAPRWLQDDYIALAKIAEPATFREAVQGENAELWKTASDEEMASILQNDTWEVVQKPPGANVIDVKWVYKVKYSTSGQVQRFKARLVAKGYKQEEGIDYDEVFAPVSKYTSIRALLALVAAEDLELELLDIKTAFLNGTLQEEVYINHPPGYPQGPPGTVLKLKKTLYGLKQAPRAWHQRLNEELNRVGFTASVADPGLYVYTKDSGSTAHIMVYVDDLLIASSDKKLIGHIKQQLMTAFDARDMGAATAYLGMKIERDRGSRTLKLSQTLMAEELVKKYNMQDSKGKTTPGSLNIKLTAEEGDPLDTEKFPYSQLVGAMMYLAVCTRPDIAYIVGAAARFMAKPTTVHWQVAKSVLRYLSGTTHYGITFGRSTDGLVGYCDADFAGDLDTRRSTTGYVFTFGGAAVSWSSKRQQTVAASTTEAEYMAAAAAVKEALWLRNLFADFGYDISPVQLLADNQSAIKLLRNPISSLGSKHINVAHHFARERVMIGDVSFSYVKTEDMLADMMTKSLPGPKHYACCKGIGIGV
jgi:hypothetical protein